MQRVETIKLIAETMSLDEIGQPVSTESVSTCICTVSSVTRAEWAAASQRALSPAAVVKVFFRDYHGEKLAEFRGDRLDIYRTYQTGDYTELYLGTRVGEINGS